MIHLVLAKIGFFHSFPEDEGGSINTLVIDNLGVSGHFLLNSFNSFKIYTTNIHFITKKFDIIRIFTKKRLDLH